MVDEVDEIGCSDDDRVQFGKVSEIRGNRRSLSKYDYESEELLSRSLTDGLAGELRQKDQYGEGEGWKVQGPLTCWKAALFPAYLRCSCLLGS